MTDDGFDPYKTLGVAHSADERAISAAYRAQARRHHPDVASDPEAQQRMAALNAARTILSDPVQRVEWDKAHGLSAHASHALSRPQVTTLRVEPKPGVPVWHLGPDGEGAAGPPPGRPSGSVLSFGRHIGWSLGEVARVDLGYLRWLITKPDGRRYRAEIEALLEASQARESQRQAPRTQPRGSGGFWRR